MQRGHHLRSSNQTSDRYEARIRHLEDVVCLLLARADLDQISLGSSTPLIGSFRYSIDQGLVPVLSKRTLKALANDWLGVKPKRPVSPIKSNCCPMSTYRSPPSPQTQSLPTPSVASLADLTVSSDPLSSSRTVTAHQNKIATIVEPHESDWLLNSSTARASFTTNEATTPTTSRTSEDPKASTFKPPQHRQTRLLSDSAIAYGRLESPKAKNTHAIISAADDSLLTLFFPNPRTVPNSDASSAIILLKTPPLRSRSLDCFLSSDRPMSDDINRGLTKLKIQPSTGDPQSSCSTMNSSPPSENLDLKADNGLTLFLSKDNLTSATNHRTDTPAHSPVNAIIIVADDLLPTSFLANPAATSATDNTSNLTPPLVSTSPPDPTATTPLLTTIPVSTLPPEPAMPNCSSDSFDIAAIGSITVMEDSTAFKDPQLWAPSLSQAALENYKDIDDYLKTLEADETEMKKKKKKKKKKKTPDPTSIPDNPVLFYEGRL
ncbi:hypothetical protein PGT21_028456 [Puccinia graminis f. sp. tritici]|uniref:Uncharacterized protein n=1 Tax=Puccinia graminis f. sp. tritici TaxID=56615 RepID=A0A5B0MXP0_PUCGR|nr:hypothetical protein PGT21_028456 [Puccinia graminis f. sp. tritici]